MRLTWLLRSRATVYKPDPARSSVRRCAPFTTTDIMKRKWEDRDEDGKILQQSPPHYSNWVSVWQYQMQLPKRTTRLGQLKVL